MNAAYGGLPRIAALTVGGVFVVALLAALTGAFAPALSYVFLWPPQPPCGCSPGSPPNFVPAPFVFRGPTAVRTRVSSDW